MESVQPELVEIMTLAKGRLEHELLLRNQYLAAENEILRSRIEGRLILSRAEKALLARLGKDIGTEALRDVSHIVTPETVLRWYRQLIARKFDGNAMRRLPLGRRRVSAEKENLVCRLALENRTWGYTRIKGAMENLGHSIGAVAVVRMMRDPAGTPPVRSATCKPSTVSASPAVVAVVAVSAISADFALIAYGAAANLKRGNISPSESTSIPSQYCTSKASPNGVPPVDVSPRRAAKTPSVVVTTSASDQSGTAAAAPS